ncbi:hypothetical protein PR048_004087 [Dryococelus australis]|uniref:Uncharacterized protein n=1 Tax=Dryococelus australis TaxID=614101 RepID=A0ABQ9I4H9_9NEOP|nr:hypothetical protein PR048_004087 [Dryococelus australis]
MSVEDIYIASELVRGRFVNCTMDNTNFLEDTPHGKGTLHGTDMVVYQEKEKSDQQTPIEISGSSSLRSLSKIPESLTEGVPGNVAKGCRPQHPIINQTADCTVRNKTIIAYSMNTDLLWTMAQVISLSDYQESLGEQLLHGNCNQSEENNLSHYETNSNMLNAVPIWSAFNYILSTPKEETRVCGLPLLDTSPTTTQTQLNFIKKLEQVFLDWVRESRETATLKVALQYMYMVDTVLLFIRSVRTADWELPLESLEEFVKYFFCLGLINYANMTGWYLVDMKLLETKHPDVWTEFSRGNWVVNKTNVPFCSLGTDEALEQEDKKMKDMGGVINITQRKQDLTRFFLTSPELSRLSAKAKEIVGITNRKRSKHHHLTASQEKRQKEDAQQMYNCIMSSTNPVTYDEKELINIATKLVFDENIQKDMSRMTERGQEFYTAFKEECIQ